MVGLDSHPEEWARYTPRQRMQRFLIYLFCIAAIVWSLTSINVIWEWVYDAPEQMGDLFSRMVPPDTRNLGTILWVLVETVNIATLATGLAVIVSLPVAYIAAQNTTPNALTLWLGRFILVSSRSVNTISGRCFRGHLCPGIIAGIRRSCSVPSVSSASGGGDRCIDRRPVEAPEATGASRFKVILYAIVPQVMPVFWAEHLAVGYQLRATVGPVARRHRSILQSAIDTFNWQEAATVLLAILALVVLGEIVAMALRRRII